MLGYQAAGPVQAGRVAAGSRPLPLHRPPARCPRPSCPPPPPLSPPFLSCSRDCGLVLTLTLSRAAPVRSSSLARSPSVVLLCFLFLFCVRPFVLAFIRAPLTSAPPPPVPCSLNAHASSLSSPPSTDTSFLSLSLSLSPSLPLCPSPSPSLSLPVVSLLSASRARALASPAVRHPVGSGRAPPHCRSRVRLHRQRAGAIPLPGLPVLLADAVHNP
eukprot:2324114-Rhodomonas_salina.1